MGLHRHQPLTASSVRGRKLGQHIFLRALWNWNSALFGRFWVSWLTGFQDNLWQSFSWRSQLWELPRSSHITSLLGNELETWGVMWSAWTEVLSLGEAGPVVLNLCVPSCSNCSCLFYAFPVLRVFYHKGMQIETLTFGREMCRRVWISCISTSCRPETFLDSAWDTYVQGLQERKTPTQEVYLQMF